MRNFLGLASGAPEGAALSESLLEDGRLAAGAGLGGFLIDVELLGEIAGSAFGVYEVAKGGSALGDGGLEDLANVVSETLKFWSAEGIRGAQGRNFREKEGF